MAARVRDLLRAHKTDGVGLMRYRFGDDAALMGAWAGARNVLGPFKPKGGPGTGGSQTPKAA